MTRLQIDNFGPIRRADITFGDLTVFVGPQATGKSLALQLFRLLIDSGYIIDQMRTYGLAWQRSPRKFWESYFGEGGRFLKTLGETRVALDGREVHLSYPMTIEPKPSAVFYTPAQRVLTLRNGWPRPFSDYSPGDPFVVRDFSERLRLLMEGQSRPGRLDASLESLVHQTFFRQCRLTLDRNGLQKRLVLIGPRRGHQIPFMAWSAGQREFVPLLLSLSWLMPEGELSRRDQIEWVVIEEPEMGLHPKAISVVLLIALELLRRGYKVCFSTHSQHILDLVWALGLLRANGADPGDMLDLFDVPRRKPLLGVAESALAKSAEVFAFDVSGDVHDITKLDPGSDDVQERTWGGLTEFGGQVSDVVARVIAEREMGPRR